MPRTYQDVDDRLKEFQVVKMDYVFVDSVREEIVSNPWRRPKDTVVQNLAELCRVPVLCPARRYINVKLSVIC